MPISLLKFLDADLFIPNLKATTRDEAFREMVDRLAESRRVRDTRILVEMLKQREELGSTGIGRGVAIPHGRSLAMTDLTLIVARSETGIDFGAVDGKPVQLVFLTVAPPQERGNLYLPVLGKIVELVKSARIRKKLLAAPGHQEFAAVLSEVGNDD